MAPDKDQRGVARPQDGDGVPRSDIGAFELVPTGPKTLTVTKTGDTSDGICGAQDCSLREAIGSGDSGDTINIPIGTYTLTLGSELTISKNLTLTGDGASSTIIQAALSSADATHRVMNVTAGNVSISGVTLRHGKAAGDGGAVLNAGTLTLTNSDVVNNAAFNGGGISNRQTLTLIDTNVSNNASSNGGGGVHNSAGSTLDVTRSTLRGNSAIGGGGIQNNSGGAVTLRNSTLSGNIASGGGGAISNLSGTLAIENTTLTDNTASGNPGGGGIFRSAAVVTLVNTIVAGNTAPSAPDCNGFTSQGHNLIGNTSGCNFSSVFGDRVDVDPKLGLLADNGGPTQTHALLTGSPAIDAGDDSVAPDKDQRGVARPQDGDGDGTAQSDIGAFEVETPPTGPFTLTVNKTQDTDDGTCNTADCSLREAIDVAASGDTVVVPAGTYTLTLGTELIIRESILLTGDRPSLTIIQGATSSGAATSRVFKVNSGEVVISGVTIRHGKSLIGSGVGGGGIAIFGGSVTIANSSVHANTADRAGGIWNASGGTLTLTDSSVNDNSGKTAAAIINDGTMTLSKSTVSGNTGHSFGTIWNTGTLIVNRSTVSDNTVTNVTGGILNKDPGTLTINKSTISGNSSPNGNGGGINNNGQPSSLNLVSSTVSGNSARSGGGIANFGTATITNSTITGNVATDNAGGLNVIGTATADLTNTIIAGNTASSSFDCAGSPTSLGHNLIGNDTGCGFTPASGDLLNINPKLGVLSDNGGPTKTHALLTGSPAIDAGDDSVAPATDQRGVARPQDGDGDGTARSDIGAFEIGAQIGPQQHTLIVEVKLEGRSDHSGAVVTISGDSPVITTFSGKVQFVLNPGNYDVAITREGFLMAAKQGLVVDRNITLKVKLLAGDVNGDGVIDAKDLVLPAKNIGKTESPFPEVGTQPPQVPPVDKTVYYGYNPNNQGRLALTGWSDGTSYKIVDLDSQNPVGIVVASGDLDKLQARDVGLNAVRHFKLETTAPLLATLGYDCCSFGGSTFYPAIDGKSLVGRKFIIRVPELSGNAEFIIFAHEASQVTIRNVAGAVVTTTTIPPDGFFATMGTPLSRNVVYQVESTGNIAIMSNAKNGYTAVPSADGTDIGTKFLFGTLQYDQGAAAVFAYEDAVFTGSKITNGTVAFAGSLTSGQFAYFSGLGTDKYRVTSTGKIGLWGGSTEGGNAIEWMGDDLTMSLGDGGRDILIHTQTQGAFLFAFQNNTTVDTGGKVYTLDAGEFIDFAANNFYRITADKPVVVRTIGGNFLNDWEVLLRPAFVGKKMPAPIQPPAGMVSWWPGDGNADDIMDGNHGTLTGDATFAQGMVGQGFSLDGTGDFVLVPDSSNLNITGDVTVDLWAKRTVFGRISVLVDKGANLVGTADQPDAYAMWFSQDDHLVAGFARADGSLVFLIGPVVTDSQFHHYAYVRSGSTHNLFVDGVVATADTFTGVPGDTSGLPLAIGAVRRDPNPPGFASEFGGIIDEVEIFNRALTASEIKAIYDAGSAGKDKSEGKFLFTSSRDGNDEIIFMNADGTNVTSLTDN